MSFFCSFRKKEIKKSPEEEVRQKLLQLLEERGFPHSLLMVERSLSEIPLAYTPRIIPRRRIDILVFFKVKEDVKPLLVIECKEKHVSKKTLTQLFGYNYYIGAPFLATYSSKGFFLFDATNKSHEPISIEIPSYLQLVKQSNNCYGKFEHTLKVFEPQEP